MTDPRQIEASARIGAAVVELHTGLYSELLADGHASLAERELASLQAGAAPRASGQPPGMRAPPSWFDRFSRKVTGVGRPE